jgi:hypothetical protein
MGQGMNYFYLNSVRRKRRNKSFLPQHLNIKICSAVSAGICLSVGRAICADRSRNRRTQILRSTHESFAN